MWRNLLHCAASSRLRLTKQYTPYIHQSLTSRMITSIPSSTHNHNHHHYHLRNVIRNFSTTSDHDTSSKQQPQPQSVRKKVKFPRGRGGWGLNDFDDEDDESENDEEFVRIPLPDGVPSDRMQLYDVLDSSRGLGELKEGVNSLFAVHGPSEVWAPHGLIEGHGAGGGLFAVLQVAGAQFKVMEGDVMYTNRYRGEVNTQVVFNDILLLGAVDWSWIGRPCIRDASVVATIEEQAKSAKIYITKFKRKTGYRRKKGHRQLITRFRINEIRYSLPHKDRLVDHVPVVDYRKTEKNFKFGL